MIRSVMRFAHEVLWIFQTREWDVEETLAVLEENVFHSGYSCMVFHHCGTLYVLPSWLVCKTSSTVRTLIRFIAIVCSFVGLQISTLHKTFSTLITCKRFFPSVNEWHENMSHKHASITKACPTAVWSLTPLAVHFRAVTNQCVMASGQHSGIWGRRGTGSLLELASQAL